LVGATRPLMRDGVSEKIHGDSTAGSPVVLLGPSALGQKTFLRHAKKTTEFQEKHRCWKLQKKQNQKPNCSYFVLFSTDNTTHLALETDL